MSSPTDLMMRGLFTAALILTFATGPLACGDSFSVGPDGEDVGGSCSNDGDCGPDSFCIRNEDFPGGTCSIACGSHDDCPKGSRCISTNGGVCALSCESSSDCRSGYDCESKSDERGGGESTVCID